MKYIKFVNFLFWEFRYRARKWIWDIAAKHSKIDGVALMFHHVTDEYVKINESCKCKVGIFEKVINSVINEGRKFVNIDDMMDIIKERRKGKFAIMTFDDVPDNFYSNAYPILKRMKIPFVLFVTTSFFDKPGFLSKEQVIELDKDELCTIGAHTLTHPMLRNVSNSKEELEVSKKILEEILGHTIEYMAYPFGRQTSISHRIMRETKKAGYRCSFGTIQSPISDLSSRSLFFLPRIVMNK